MSSRAIQTAFWILATAGLAIIVLRPLENKMVYFPERTLHGSPADAGLDFEDVRLATSDGVRIHAWHVRVPDAKAIVILFHGNAGNISGRVPWATAFAAERMEALLVDYRGFGRSEGAPSEEGLYRDADAAWEWARPRGLPVVAYGESLGGAVAIDLASRHPVAALVVQSSFTRLSEMADRIFPFAGALVSQRFDSIDKIRRVRASILVVHGDRDEIVPYEMGARLHAAAPSPEPFFTVAGAHHNDVVDLAATPIAERVAALVSR